MVRLERIVRSKNRATDAKRGGVGKLQNRVAGVGEAPGEEVAALLRDSGRPAAGPARGPAADPRAHADRRRHAGRRSDRARVVTEDRSA